ncbi:MAG TPA: hypothetical protein DHW82_12470 [Spirochaetia bacterium]|nr:MAG: hypothetical protein A2Y41_03885 [Spirochaetes bacterium GWB1_36_13]HCL57805.1 hypothetical protein [Spirochaetia bacterium]
MGLNNKKQILEEKIKGILSDYKKKYVYQNGIEEFFYKYLSNMKNLCIETLDKEAKQFIEEYRMKFSGSNPLYGFLYHAYVESIVLANNADLSEVYKILFKR